MLSTRARYSIVALLDIAGAASHGGVRPVALSEIAGARGLSLNYLEQLAVKWRRTGLVTGRRGPAGGYVLARPAAAITLADIAAAVGETVSTAGDDEKADLSRQAGCPAQQIADFLTARIQADLAAITLADVAAGRLDSAEPVDAVAETARPAAQ